MQKKNSAILLIGIIIIVSYTGLSGTASAQTPTTGMWTYGGAASDIARDVIATSDGGYLLAGATNSEGAGHYDVILNKVDAEGNEEWHKTFGGANADWAYAIVATSDGGYALAGDTASYGVGTDIWLLKVDSSGTLEWSKTYGGTGIEYGQDLIVTSDGGFAIAGYTNSYGAGGNDFFLVKTDSAGTMQWSEAYGGTGTDQGYGLVEASDGGYAVAGYTNSVGAGNYDAWLVKTDSTGTKEWSKNYGTVYVEYGYGIISTSDGGYAIIGQNYLSSKSYDICLIKTNSAGTKEWSKNFGGAGSDCGYAVKTTSDGGYIVTGTYVETYNGEIDLWLGKLDSSGNTEWSKDFGGAGAEFGYDVISGYGGGYAAVGYTNSYGAGDKDMWLVVVDSEGGFGSLTVLPEVPWGTFAAVLAGFGLFLALKKRGGLAALPKTI